MISDYYFKDWKVEFNDCYSNGKISYASFSRFLQDTAGYHAQESGYGLKDMAANHQGWVLTKFRLEIDELPKLDDVITVKTWIKFVNGPVSDRDYQIIRNGEIIASASSSWLVFNLKLRRPEKLKLEANNINFIEENSTLKPTYKINLEKEFTLVEKRSVRFSALDMVQHVSNLRYIEWMLDSLDARKILKKGIKSFSLNYIKELTLNDHFDVLINNSDNCTTVLFQNTVGKAAFAADIDWN